MKKIYFLLLFITTSVTFSQSNIFDACRKGTVTDVNVFYLNDNNSINKTNESGYTPLILASYHGNEEVVEFLVDKVDDINGSSDYGTPLMAAVVNGNERIVEMLLKNNADTNITDMNGTTALHYATLFKKPEIVKLLVKAGAKSDIKDGRGQSALDYAMLSKNEQILKLLKNI